MRGHGPSCYNTHMSLRTNKQITEDMFESKKQRAKKELEEYSDNIHKKLTDYFERSNRIWKDDENLKKVMFTVAAGALSVYASLGTNHSNTLTNLGFFLLAFSMVFSLASKVFAPQILLHSNANLGLLNIELEHKRLDDLISQVDQKNDRIPIFIAKKNLEIYEDLLRKDKNKYRSVNDKIEQFLHKINLDAQIVSDSQKYSFILGIFVISLSLITPVLGTLFTLIFKR